MTRYGNGGGDPHPTCSECGGPGRDRYRYKRYGRLEPKRKHESGGPDGLKFAYAPWEGEPWVCGACRIAQAAEERKAGPGFRPAAA